MVYGLFTKSEKSDGIGTPTANVFRGLAKRCPCEIGQWFEEEDAILFRVPATVNATWKDRFIEWYCTYAWPLYPIHTASGCLFKCSHTSSVVVAVCKLVLCVAPFDRQEAILRYANMSHATLLAYLLDWNNKQRRGRGRRGRPETGTIE
jgi:hypothetical protein